jgi:phage terminase large subunit-like protein
VHLGHRGQESQARLASGLSTVATDPLDFEATIERTLLEMRGRYEVREIRYDPYQLVAVAQRLTAGGLPMVEFPQTVPNLTEASTNLYELTKGRNLAVYPDDDTSIIRQNPRLRLSSESYYRFKRRRASASICSTSGP